MTIEHVIEGLNKHIEYKRKMLNIEAVGHLVLQKTIEPNSVSKAYKNFVYKVWFVSKGKKNIVLTISKTERALAGHEDTVLKDINIQLCVLLFDWIGSDSYSSIIKGEYYDGDKD